MKLHLINLYVWITRLFTDQQLLINVFYRNTEFLGRKTNPANEVLNPLQVGGDLKFCTHKHLLSCRVISFYTVNVPYSDILGNVVTVLNIVMICKSDMFKWNYSARTCDKTSVK